MKLNSVAEDLLLELGISEPTEIDLEAIAESCGATVCYVELTGCEASIIGVGDRAFINVNKNAKKERQRFSIAHELGHWCVDRGTVASHASTSSTYIQKWSKNDPEVRANKFAAELLMPSFMLKPLIRSKEVSIKTTKQISKDFNCSLTASAIRLVQLTDKPSLVLLTSGSSVLWQFRSETVPSKFWVGSPGSNYSIAHGIHKNQQEIGFEKEAEVSSSAWFSVSSSRDYQIVESSIRCSSECVLTILWWQDESQILQSDEDNDDEDDRFVSNSFRGRR